MARTTQGLALILPVPAVLAAVAVWLRVDQHGWTPDRLYGASAAALGLGYGVIYALAVLRGAGWMARIRQGNIVMALALIVVSALWLTPVLNPEAISARSQVARVIDGRTAPAAMDLHALDQWGRAGKAARLRLAEQAQQPGFEALGQALANPAPGTPMPEGEDPEPLRRALAGVLPLQPATATATRDIYLAAADVYELRTWLDLCAVALPQGGPACVMVVADLLPALPGEEVIMILPDQAGGYVRYEGLSFRDGLLMRHAVWSADQGSLPQIDAANALVTALQAAAPALSPAPLNQIGLPDGTSLSLIP